MTRSTEAGDKTPDSEATQADVVRRHFDRHRIYFALAMLPALAGGYLTRVSQPLAALLLLAGAACWVVSGLACMKAERHMFSVISSSAWGMLRVKSSGRSPLGSKVVGVILIVLAGGLAFAAIRLVVASLPA